MENEPRYVGTIKDLRERMVHEFAPALIRNAHERRTDEVAGIIQLQKHMTNEILVFGDRTADK